MLDHMYEKSGSKSEQFLKTQFEHGSEELLEVTA